MADQERREPTGSLFIMLQLPLRPPTPTCDLTEAEQHIVQLIARGLSTREMAQARGVQPRTISNQLATLYRKLEVFDRFELLSKLFSPHNPTPAEETDR